MASKSKPALIPTLPDSPLWNSFHESLRTWPPRNGSVSRPYPLAELAAPKSSPVPLDQQIAMAVRALAETKSEKKEVDKGFAERLEHLQNEIARLSNDILTGQGQLPLEIE